MGKLNRKMSISHIFFIAVFYAIVSTILDHFIQWDNRLVAGIFGGFITLIGGVLALFILKND
ncbi:hypothetical protein [Gottfriedia luciferensis]|uniref:hypothetical protein n=1 Tax=Gottfriedia luciferensis TaxID=178774 RepID=UPI000B4436E9|nr:hypothetical protein [Gottfriedia luciferensis]